MNKARRKEIAMVKAELEEIKERIENILDDEQKKTPLTMLNNQ